MIARTWAKVMWIGVFIVVGLSASKASESRSSVDAVFTMQRQHLLRLRFIDMPYSEKAEYCEYLRSHGADYASQGDAFSVNRFRMEGEKFCVDQNLEGSLATPSWVGPRTYAFDLKNFQIYDQHRMNLTIPDRGFGSMDKANVPYQNTYKWVFYDQETWSFSGFQDKASWEGLKRRVTRLTSSQVQNHDCVVMECDYSERNRHTRIHFATDLDYFPVRVEVFRDGTRVVDHVVTQADRIETPEGFVVVPTVTVEQQWDSESGNHLFTMSFVIDTEQLAVNKDIPDDAFTIPPHVVRSYTNMLNKRASFNIGQVVDPTLENPSTAYSAVLSQPQPQISQEIDSAAVASAEAHRDATDVRVNDSGARRSIAIGVGAVTVLVLTAFIGRLLVRWQRPGRTSTQTHGG